MIEITNKTIAGVEMTALRFGPDNYDIPIHLMQKERDECVVVTDSDITSLPWNGVTKDTKGQYILLPKCSLEPIWSISTTNRSKALELVRKLSLAIKVKGKKFSELNAGYFPLYRIYIKDGKDILILPKDASEILSISLIRDEMDKCTKALVKRDTEPGFTLILQMAQLLYYSATGILPYEKEEIRRSGFNEMPLEFFVPELEKETLSYISSLLSTSSRNQRKISGNNGPEAALIYFLDSSESLKWNLEDRSEEEKDALIASTEENKEFSSLFSEKCRKAKRRKFWREKGAIILISASIASFVLYFVGNWLYQTFKPPVTRDMEPEAIISHMYSCQNSLDAQNISAGFKKDVSQYNEVLNIYVSRQTRMAYESTDFVIDAENWVNKGMPSVPASSWIYGVIHLSTERIDDDTYSSTVLWYTPMAFDDENEALYPEKEGCVRVFVYSVTQAFDFEWNKRGWWVCSGDEITSYTLEDVIYSETTPLS